MVCCQHGVITHDGSRKDYWVPYDKYTVTARAQDTCPLEDALESVRNLVLEGRYNATDQRRISYSKYHEIEIGSSSPVKKGKGCSCKKGCGNNCGCKEKGFRCSNLRLKPWCSTNSSSHSCECQLWVLELMHKPILQVMRTDAVDPHVVLRQDKLMTYNESSIVECS